jgi:hypothetical protein
MTKLETIEHAVLALSADELRAFADWFASVQADLWDKEIERDALAGLLDIEGEAALAHHRAGRTKPL